MAERGPVLILGGSGMLGHKLWQVCRERLDTYATVRPRRLEGPAAAVLDEARTLTGVRAAEPASVDAALDATGARVAVNCIGIVKQSEELDDPAAAIRVNSLFPQELAKACRARDVRLIQVSTDCVFSGRRGDYREEDIPDAEDLYGRTKLLGEVGSGDALTIRTSIIGRELAGAQGLLEWFRAQRGGVAHGFRRAVFSGLTTTALSRLIVHLIEEHPGLSGIRHAGGARIDKHTLLVLLREAFALDVEVVPDDDVVIDRSLDSSRLRAETGWEPPAWPAMAGDLVSDPTPYDSIRRETAHR